MKLTICQLRGLIEKHPDDAEVLIQMRNGCCDDTLDLEVDDYISSLEYQTKYDGHVIVVVKAIPGYKSRRQAKMMKEVDERYWQKPYGPKEEK